MIICSIFTIILPQIDSQMTGSLHIAAFFLAFLEENIFVKTWKTINYNHMRMP